MTDGGALMIAFAIYLGLKAIAEAIKTLRKNDPTPR